MARQIPPQKQQAGRRRRPKRNCNYEIKTATAAWWTVQNKWMDAQLSGLWHKRIDRAVAHKPPIVLGGIAGYWGSTERVCVRVCDHNALELPLSSFSAGCAVVWQWRMRMLALATCPGRGRTTGSSTESSKWVARAGCIRQRPSPSAGRQLAGGCSWWLMPRPLSLLKFVALCCESPLVAGCLAMSLHDAHSTWLSTKLFCSKLVLPLSRFPLVLSLLLFSLVIRVFF